VIGSGARHAIDELDSHDSLTADELTDVISQKLANLLNHAWKNVPYYKDLAAGPLVEGPYSAVTERLREFPLLTKETIRREGDRLISDLLDGNKLDPNSTSGSTGSPLSFFTDRRSKSYRKATVARNRKWLGIRMGESVAHLWGSPIDQRRAQSLRGRIHGYVTRELFLSAYALDEESLRRYASTIKSHNARLLIGYPSVLSKFGEFCRNERITIPSLTAIICSAEALDPHQRHTIKSDFGVPVYNRYGCREVGDIAQEVPGQGGLLVNADRIHVEILDHEGGPCEPGTVGEIVVTDLDNYGMPLIRYAIGDRGSWAPISCNERQYPYPVLETVEGRSLDVVVCPSGNRVGGTFWTILLRNRPGIEKFRVIQDSVRSIIIEYTTLPDAPDIDLHYFQQKIAETCGVEMSVTFRKVPAITAAPNEKMRLVITRIARGQAEPGATR